MATLITAASFQVLIFYFCRGNSFCFAAYWNISNAGALTDLSQGHTVEEAIYALDKFIQSVYASSTDKDIGPGDFDTLSIFICIKSIVTLLAHL